MVPAYSRPSSNSRRFLSKFVSLVFLLALVAGIMQRTPGHVEATLGLLRFTATCAGSGQILVEWETGYELGVNGFWLQRSTQPDLGFARIDGFVTAQGGVTGATYQLLDTDILGGRRYYRLEVVNGDGTTEYSGPVINGWCPFTTCESVNGIPRAECEALVSLYDSTNGPGWTNSDGWLSTCTPCSWYGVICEAGHVQTLDLHHNQLSGAIPPELGSLANLEWLDLSVNRLVGVIPPELGNLASLRHLVLYGNAPFGGAIPSELGNLANLELLDLTLNYFSGTIPPELGKLTNLQILNLGWNHLNGGIPPELGSLTNLQGLDLYRNGISGTIPPELGKLTNLQNLNLGWNHLNGGIPPELGNLTNLVRLNVSNNQFSGPLLHSLIKIHLDSFGFYNTNLCEPPDAAFQDWLASISDLQRTGVICKYAYLPLCAR